MGMANIHGVTQIIILVNFTRGLNMDQGFLNSKLLEMSMRVNTSTISGMVMVSTDGRMATYITGNLTMRWDKVMVKWYGIQVKFMRGNGEMAYKMEWGNFVWSKAVRLNLSDSHNLSTEWRCKQQKMSLSYLQYWAKSLIYHHKQISQL